MSQPSGKTVFEISSLQCAYHAAGGTVLSVPSLKLELGKIYFILGSSGSGKSTLLETLGLMNHTIASGDVLLHTETGSISYSSLWKAGNTKGLQEAREKYFSFIFQQTNLLDNFSAIENAALARMIKQKENLDAASPAVRDQLEAVGLLHRFTSGDASPVMLSGGQRQRLSFSRALAAPFTILFCDEPTGNLDIRNAQALFDIIRNTISDNKIAIIVSHDIDLALSYADEIICLKRKPELPFAIIDESSILRRASWQGLKDEKLQLFKQEIRDSFEIDNKELKKVADTKEVGAGSRFRKLQSLFLWNEGLSLAGKGMRNLIVLVSLFLLSFLTLGTANGVLNYLRLKLSDPFVNWVTVSIPFSRNDATLITELKSSLTEEKLTEKYFIKAATSYTERPLRFYTSDAKDIIPVRGRTVEMDPVTDPLLDMITGPRNFVRGDSSGFRSEKDLSLIVTVAFLDQLGYPQDAEKVLMYKSFKNDSTGEKTAVAVPVYIRSVVKEIPGKVNVMFTPYFYEAYSKPVRNTFDIRNKDGLYLRVKGDSALAQKVYSSIKKGFSTDQQFSAYSPQPSTPVKNEDSYVESYLIAITFFGGTPLISEIGDMSSLVLGWEGVKENAERYYDYHNMPEAVRGKLNDDQLSLTFTRLEEIRNFATFFYQEYNEPDDPALLEVDIGRVKEKENFSFLANLTRAIVVFIILIISVSIGLFLSSIFTFHLERQQANIGTLVAIGMSQQKVAGIYAILLGILIFISVAAGTVLAFAGGKLLELYFDTTLHLEEGFSYFRLFDGNTGYALLFIVIFSYLYVYLAINRILRKTPGDLIYRR